MDSRKILIAAAAVATSPFFSQTIAFAADLSTQFEQVGIGMDRHRVVALLGRDPDAESETVTLFVHQSRLTWNAPGGRILAVSLIAGHVFRTKVCVGIPMADC